VFDTLICNYIIWMKNKYYVKILCKNNVHKQDLDIVLSIRIFEGTQCVIQAEINRILNQISVSKKHFWMNNGNSVERKGDGIYQWNLCFRKDALVRLAGRREELMMQLTQ